MFVNNFFRCSAGFVVDLFKMGEMKFKKKHLNIRGVSVEKLEKINREKSVCCDLQKKRSKRGPHLY